MVTVCVSVYECVTPHQAALSSSFSPPAPPSLGPLGYRVDPPGLEE